MKKVIGFYRDCDLLTMLGSVFAVTGMILAIKGMAIYAIFCLIGSGICDAFDGYLARRHENTPQQTRYGVELDSLSDVICFGVLPVIIAISNSEALYLYIASVFFVLCGIVRLAYYNMLAGEEDNDSHYFVGIPITTSAIIFPIAYIILYYTNIGLIGIVGSILFLLLGLGYVLPLKVKKLTNLGKVILSAIGIISIITILIILFV